MLSIRREQMEQMRTGLLLRFGETLLEELRQGHPEAGDEALREWLRHGLRWADEFQFVTETEIRRWISVVSRCAVLRRAYASGPPLAGPPLPKPVLRIVYQRGRRAAERLDGLEAWVAAGARHG